jgi:hypothetical protein
MPFPIGTLVDLYDSGFKQWRGEYTVVKITETGLHKIKNTKTNSQQFVSEDKLRMGRLRPFRMDCLYEPL